MSSPWGQVIFCGLQNYNTKQKMESCQLLDSFIENKSICKEIEDRGAKDDTLFFGIYKLGKIIGQGAFANVYQAYNTHTGRTVALKIVNYQQAYARYESEDTRHKVAASLLAEQSNMRKCHSAHIIKLYDSFENSECKVYVLEYCNQGNLQSYLKKRGALHEKDAIVVLKQIIFGLAEMHRNGIIHRDLKPANILIHNGIFKIADLGFSKALQRAEEVEKHTCLGTKSTMAPQVAKQEPYGLKADIWSIGMIFFLMIQYDTDLSLAQNFKVIERFIHNNNKFKSKLLFEDSMSLEVRDFLKKTLQVDQDKRLNWEETLAHPLFAKNQEDLPEFFVPNMQERFQQLKNNIELRLSSKLNNPEEMEEYQLLSRQYLQCRKSEYLLKNLIVPLEQLKMINLEDHHHIELMLLLTNRCKANLNFSLYQIEHHYDYRLWESFHKQIASLKERVELKFDYYSELLTNYENKLSTIIKDKLHKIADKRGYKQKEKFLNGIEGLDFNVHQQIQFTCQKYISSIVDGLRTKDTEEKNVKRLLTAYADVALIRQEDLSTVSLSERIRQLFQGK